jgi:hypothetical protein
LKTKNGKYDLGKWDRSYWARFEQLLKLCEERDIIIQIEVWDRFDFSQESWRLSAFNPVNNINYSTEESGVAPEYPKHPYSDQQPFFHTIQGMQHYTPDLEVIKKYQEKFVDKMLSHSLKYGNVLYCMDNETSTPPEWGLYWMDYIRKKAGNKKIYVTDMFDNFHRPASCIVCQQAIQYPSDYLFLDVSQINSRNFGQAHWDTLQWIIHERNKYEIRPVNCTKVYGGGNSSWGSGSNDDGVQRFCRDVIGGCAAVRHHRPNSGNGLNEKAQASIHAIRKVETLVKFWEVQPYTELLSGAEENEAYLVAKKGEKYVLFFPGGGTVKVDLEVTAKTFRGKWISLETGEWADDITVSNGGAVELATPDSTGWFAVLVNGSH